MLSAIRYAQRSGTGNRALGNALIAFGALLPGIGGGMTKFGYVEWLYVCEFVGLLFIWAGYACCVSAPSCVPIASATLVDAQPVPDLV